jgi:hypothetical protein
MVPACSSKGQEGSSVIYGAVGKRRVNISKIWHRFNGKRNVIVTEHWNNSIGSVMSPVRPDYFITVCTYIVPNERWNKVVVSM